MFNLIKQIEAADAESIDTILKAVLLRYRILFPDWEISTISILKNTDRNEQLDQMIAVLQKMKTLPTA